MNHSTLSSLMKMAAKSAVSDQRRALWRRRLDSAIRTALACAFVGCTSLYGPVRLQQLLAFPAFSYVTTILIVSNNATLGDALRGCWCVLYATAQVMVPSVASLWMIGPERFTRGVAALAVALLAFAVALPESTHLLAKRIAFGQIVIVCVGTVIHGADTDVLMHPVHVASSTALGAIASVLALLLPFPRLAFYEVRKTLQLYAENASERLNHLVEAFSGLTPGDQIGSIAHANSLSKAGSKLIGSIRKDSEGMNWERPDIKFVKINSIDPAKRLQNLEIPLRGMEMALSSSSSFVSRTINEEVGGIMQNLRAQIDQNLEQMKSSVPFYAKPAPEITKLESYAKPAPEITKLESLSSLGGDNLSSSFFLYCLKLLLHVAENPVRKAGNCEDVGMDEESSQPEKGSFRWARRIDFALKCSLSLGLAVFFGLIYEKGNGYWSGLTIAISFSTERQATFTVANARAQGTAMGSVYGILACFIFENFQDLRIFSILPWVIFTSFLMHSRMYGQAGGISAVLGALLILGRKNFGRPSEFAIARITEASIGLICLISVEILFNPTRAAMMAKIQFSKSLGLLQDCFKGIVFSLNREKEFSLSCPSLKEQLKRLESHVNQLESYVAEAESEPNFWFKPFQGACYGKFLESLWKMMNLLRLVSFQMEFLRVESTRIGSSFKELDEKLDSGLEIIKKKYGYSLKLLENATLIKSLKFLEKQTPNKSDPFQDIEMGKLPSYEEAEKILSSSFRSAEEAVERIYRDEEDEESKSQTILSLRGLEFCVGCLMRETMEVEKEVVQLLKLENPSSAIDLLEIYCKTNAIT